MLNDQTLQEREERVLNALIRELFTDERRHGLRRRLEEAAYIFAKRGLAHTARLAVAAAIGLEQPLLRETLIVRLTQSPTHARHPYVLALVEQALEMAREIEAAGMGDAIPHRTAYDPIE